MRSSPFAEKSLEYVLAARLPKKTRTPTALDPDSLSVSTWPSRTTVENSSPSRTTHSAADAPHAVARLTSCWANDFRSVSIWFPFSSCLHDIKINPAQIDRDNREIESQTYTHCRVRE